MLSLPSPGEEAHAFIHLGHIFQCSTVINCRLQRGTETETNFFLGLGVSELDRGMEIVIFG
jgi:hypothetical protein